MKRLTLLLILCAVTTESYAQRGRGLLFGSQAEISSDGLSVRLFRGATPVPLPQPTVFHYRRADGATQERFLPRDLWYPSGYRGRWEDSNGNRMTVAVVGDRFPSGITTEHISREDYATFLQKNPPGRPQNMNQLMEWVGHFAGAATKGPPRPVRLSPRLQGGYAVDFEGMEGTRLGFIFRFAGNTHGVDSLQWFLVLFEFAQGTDRAAAVRSIEQDFVGTLATIPRAADLSIQASQRFQNKGLAVGDKTSPAFLESRERAINSIRGLNGWWFVETPNYVLVSDLSGGRRSFVQRLQEDLEGMRTIYTRILLPLKPIEAVSLVRVFADEADYKRYVGPENEWSGGLWMPSKRELLIRTFEWGNERERRERIASIVYHEAFHQYLFYAMDMIETAPWFNEGFATFYEGAELGRSEFRLHEVEKYAGTLEEMVKAGPLPVARFLMIDYDEFYQRSTGNEERRRQHYALGWGLIYYLKKAAPLEPENQYEEIIGRYLHALSSTRNGAQATRAAFEGIDMDTFTSDFTSFWTSASRRNSARRNQAL